MLFVKDLDRMIAFYRDVVGLHLLADTRLENWAEFAGDGTRFSLHAIPAGIATEVPSPPHPREHSNAKFTFAVRNVESTLAQIESMGLPLLHRSWGGTEAVDPEGNVFALIAGG